MRTITFLATAGVPWMGFRRLQWSRMYYALYPSKKQDASTGASGNKESAKKIKFLSPILSPDRSLDVVLHTIYLIFNEGYNSSSKTELIRKDLCEKAIRLAYLLTENNYTQHAKCMALLSLLILQVSRIDARLDESGGIVLLEDQDRSTHSPSEKALLDRKLIGIKRVSRLPRSSFTVT